MCHTDMNIDSNKTIFLTINRLRFNGMQFAHLNDLL